MSGNLFSMTDIQKNIWDMCCAYPEIPLANNGGIIRLPEKMTIEEALNITYRTVKQNPTLRLRLNEDEKFYISEAEDFHIDVLDFTGCSREQFDQKLQVWFQKPFVLYHAPLLEMRLIQYEEELYIGSKYHHLIMDSTAIRQQIMEYYEGAKEFEESVQDERFLEVMRTPASSSRHDAQLAEQWRDVEINWKLREKASDGRADICTCVLPQELSEALLQEAEKQRIFPEALLCGVFYVYITAVKQVKQAALGKLLINRNKKQMDMYGMMVNILPVLIEVKEDEPYFDLCRRIHRAHFGLMRSSNFSYRRFCSQAGITEQPFDIYINFRNDRYLPIVMAESGKEYFNGCSEVPLRLYINVTKSEIEYNYIYQIDNYDGDEIRELHENLTFLLKQCLDNPAVGEMEYVNHQYLEGIKKINDTKQWQFNTNLWDIFLTKVKEAPDNILLEEPKERRSMTRKEVKRAVCRVACLLREHGVSRGDMVGLVLERNCMLPVAMMAVMKVGAAFLPIGYGEDEQTIGDFAVYCKCLLSGRRLSVPHIFLDNNIMETGTEDKNGWQHEKEEVAYGIFTSGSTGNPKIALISEEALMCRLQWMQECFGMEGRILQKTVNTFDVSIWELLMPFLTGSRTCLLCEGDERYPDAITAAMAEKRTEIVHFVPSMLSATLHYLGTEKGKEVLPQIGSSLKILFSSGEALKPALAQEVHRLLPDTMLVNLYGPAECSIDVSCHICTPGEMVIPIGFPVYNTQLHVLGQNNKEVPFGEEGQLAIGGTLVGEGYLNNPTEQEKRFIKWNGKRLYLTGDRVKRAANGEICYIGRENQEVKVRGIRVDISEIEQLMLEIPEVTGACVLVHGNTILAFYESNLEIRDWKERLGNRLPRRTLPNRFFRMERFPVQKSGKTNRKKLLEWFEQTGGKSREDIEEEKRTYSGKKETLRDAIRNTVKRYFSEIDVSDEEDLQLAGMDSLTVVYLVSDLLEQGYDLSVRDFYEHSSVNGLFKVLSQKRRNPADNLNGVCKNNSKFLCWFDKNGKLTQKRSSEHVIVCVPYAGGEISLFDRLAVHLWKQGIQLCVVDGQSVEESTLEERAKKIAASLVGIPRLSVMGCCVGAALALCLVECLRTSGQRIGALYLCGSLPYGCGRDEKVLWDRLNPELTDRFLSVLYGKKVSLLPKQRKRLTEDARTSALFFRDSSLRMKNLPVYFLYGEKDLLTVGYKVRVQAWKKWGVKPQKVITLKGCRHFFVKTHPGKTAAVLVKGEKKSHV